MRSIPRQLLIHSAEIRNPLSEDSFGNILYSEPEYIKYVRIDFTDNFELQGMNRENTLTAVLIYDCKNSSPSNFNFKKGQAVEFDGNLFTVVSVVKLYEKTQLHHIEITLA